MVFLINHVDTAGLEKIQKKIGIQAGTKRYRDVGFGTPTGQNSLSSNINELHTVTSLFRTSEFTYEIAAGTHSFLFDGICSFHQ